MKKYVLYDRRSLFSAETKHLSTIIRTIKHAVYCNPWES